MRSFTGFIYDLLGSDSAHPALKPHNGMKFSTPDMDNDAAGGANCAKLKKGGWWLTNCYVICPTCQGSPWYVPHTNGWPAMKNIQLMVKLQ